MILINLFNKLYQCGYNYHKIIMSNEMSWHEISIERKKLMIYEYNEKFNICKKIKNLYKSIFFLISNLYYKITHNDLISNLYIEKLLSEQSQNMVELRTKTNKIMDSYPDLYSGVVKWISGNCWLNPIITNGYKDKLSNTDLQIYDSISEAIKLVEPIEKPLVLFHGFEKFSNYDEMDFAVGKKFTFKGILSKTSFFPIAEIFAYSQNYFQPKYFIIIYSSKSKHIGLDIKQPKYDEFEYIGKPNESFEIIKICKRFRGIHMETFYILKNLDY